METYSSLYDDTFRRWKSARTTLTRAITDYLATSAGLCGVLSTPTCHSPPHPLEKTLTGIDLELPSLQLEEEMLKQTRTTLANERNRSRVLSPVCKLPPEILATTFVIATSRYTRRDRTASHRTHSSPTALSSVSSSWRHIALETPSLWSYIDLVVSGQPMQLHHKQTEVWVTRSRNATLYVDIREHRSISTQDTMPRYYTTRLLEFLAPLMHRVCALEMSITLQAHGMLSSVLALWAKYTSTSIKKTLQIVNNQYFGGDPDVPLGPASGGSFTAEESNTLFRSFHRLLVQSCRISESVVFHEGLVELHLEDLSRPTTQHELVAMLSTCPRLRTLVVANCRVEPSDEIPSPVTLNHLKFLSLESENNSPSFVHVFPLLAIGSEGLSMSLTLSNDPDFIDEARAFFSRTKVTRLHAWSIYGHVPLSVLLYPIPHLETLGLDSVDISGETADRFFYSNDGSHSVVPWPRLRTLYLKDARVDISCLHQLVQLHRSLTRLHIYRPMRGEQSKIPMMDGERGQLLQSIHGVEDFQIESDWGSRTIGTWDFVILDPY